MGFNTNTVLQSYTDYIENDETNLLDKLLPESGWLLQHNAILKYNFQLEIESDVHTHTDRHTS